ncbi:MAG: sialidase family protein [Candidatus Ratteibacteria bacterium]|nr:sialidase family protein [Candidatus Ratteibacteria bacterium]
MKKIDLLPALEKNPRNSEGSMIELKNGKIMFIYSHFYGGPEDNAPAFLAVRYSFDKGESWTDKDEVIIENEGKENVMSASLLRLKNGEILLGYLVKNSLTDERYYIRKSSDEGKLWSEKILVTNKEFSNGNYFVVNNDRVIQLSNGRIIVPSCHHPCPTGKSEDFGPGEVIVFYSDDNGNTWKSSKNILLFPEKEDKVGFQEPGVVELRDGKILMWIRTNVGCQYYSYSEDSGETWSEGIPSPIISPLSPASIKRIPQTGDLLCIYNDHSGKFSYPRWYSRTPLVSAISKDEGKSWQNHFLIEDDPNGRFCYTSIMFIEDKIILSYSAERVEHIWGLSRITILDIKEIYGREKNT